ncbi:MAG: hypothetical protein HQK53_05085 [Oligoflexia bacterium]|nr:hypothetical protein [Oligoflexia bacterium]
MVQHLRLIIQLIMIVFFIEVADAQEIIYYKDQQHSVIDWEQATKTPEDWMSYERWLDDSKKKESDKYWRVKRINENHREVAGRVLSCVGHCLHYRGTGYSNPDFRSIILEGDDLETRDNSYLWIFLQEGTLVRLAPNSSITFNELDVSKGKNFIYARVNQGLIYWYSRNGNKMDDDNLSETDTIFLPLKWYAANVFKKVQSPVGNEELISVLDDDDTQRQHVARLNNLLKKNNQFFSRPTYTLLVMPNGNIYGKNLQTLLFVNYLKDSFIKCYSTDNGIDGKNEFAFRGYTNLNTSELKVNQWYRVKDSGMEINDFPDGGKVFAFSELLIRRPVSILVARELMLEYYSKELFSPELTAKEMQQKHGYYLWNEANQLEIGKSNEQFTYELDLRIAFLQEYTRRIETTNLVSSSNLDKSFQEAIDNTSSASASASASVERVQGGEVAAVAAVVAGEDLGQFLDTGYNHSYHQLALGNYVETINQRNLEKVITDNRALWMELWLKQHHDQANAVNDETDKKTEKEEEISDANKKAASG